MSPDHDNLPSAVPLRLPLDRACREQLRGLLQAGVAVPVRAPCQVSAFLVEQLGIEPDYVERRITTVFLDGQVVDSLGEATLRNGGRLALSAAMPGLVGATLRKGGYYAAMRSEITLGAEAGAEAGRPLSEAVPGVVNLKLFNLLIDELVGAVLRQGILLGWAEAVSLLEVLGRPAPPLPPGTRFVLLTAMEPGSK
jgi:hypothetical protein